MKPSAETPTPSHVVLYDGECGLCDRFVHFTIEHDPRGQFVFAALQTAFAAKLLQRFGRTNTVVDRVYVVTDYETERAALLDRSDAALFVMRDAPWPWRGLWTLRFVPRFLRDVVYRCVAAMRHRLFGAKAVCAIPDAETRRRFLTDA